MLISNSHSSLFSLLTHSFTFFHSPPLLSLSFLPPLPSSSPLSIPHLSITSLAFLFLSISPFLLFYFSLYHLSCFPISLSITSLAFLFLSLSPLLISYFSLYHLSCFLFFSTFLYTMHSPKFTPRTRPLFSSWKPHPHPPLSPPTPLGSYWWPHLIQVDSRLSTFPSIAEICVHEIWYYKPVHEYNTYHQLGHFFYFKTMQTLWLS